jgi:hypothetical protein
MSEHDKTVQALAEEYETTYLSAKWESGGEDLRPREHFMAGYKLAKSLFGDAWEAGFEAGKKFAREGDA